MMTHPSFVLLVATIALNQATLGAEQLVLEDVLKASGYGNLFCGVLIAHAYFFGAFFMLMGATWVDNSTNYVKVSRIASALCALTILTFNTSILLPNIKNVILGTNIMASFGCSLMYPSLLQVALRSSVTIIPEAAVPAIVIVLQQGFACLLMNLLTPLKELSPRPNGYQAPMIIFSCITMIVNILYVTSFKAPSRDELQRRLRLGDRDVLVNEE